MKRSTNIEARKYVKSSRTSADLRYTQREGGASTCAVWKPEGTEVKGRSVLRENEFRLESLKQFDAGIRSGLKQDDWRSL